MRIHANALRGRLFVSPTADGPFGNALFRALGRRLEIFPTLDAWGLAADEWPLVARVAASLGRDVCAECRAGTPCEAWLDPVLRRLWWQHADERAQALDAAREAAARAREARRRARQKPGTAVDPWRAPAVSLPPPRGAHETAARVLGIGWPSDADAVQRAFRRAALRAHPDVGGSDAAMRAVIAARELLLR